MDIEGSEYAVLEASRELFARVSGFVIEFYRLDLNWGRFEAAMTSLDRQFYVAHLHGNNYDSYIQGSQVPMTLEVTLINKALCATQPASCDDRYPLAELDRPNNSNRPQLRLNFE
jgi:hypothetical protein